MKKISTTEMIKFLLGAIALVGIALGTSAQNPFYEAFGDAIVPAAWTDVDSSSYDRTTMFPYQQSSSMTQAGVDLVMSPSDANDGATPSSENSQTLLLSSDGTGQGCEPITSFPYLQEFIQVPPPCWNLISTHDTTWTTYYNNSYWASCLGSADVKTEQLESCVFDFSQCNNPLLTFVFRSNMYYVNSGDIDFKIYVSTDGGDSYSNTPIWSLSQFGAFDAWTSTSVVISLSTLVGESSVKFKFSYEGRRCQVLFNDLEFIDVPGTGYDSIIYVTETGAGSQTGENWGNATSSIKLAQLIAKTNNAVVWVAAGTYYGDTTSSNAFFMRDGVSVYGGFAGVEPADYDLSQRDFETNTTILDGQHSRRVVFQSSSFNNRAVLDGFTLRNGYTTGDGGGAYLRHNTELLNCRLVNNEAQGSGGGLYFKGSYDDDTIKNCSFVNNTSGNYGGGAYLDNASFVNCLVANNVSQYGGGGVYCYSSTIANSTIVRNSSNNSGGGLYARYLYLVNSVVWGNKRNAAADNIYVDYSLSCNYSAVEGGYSGGTNVINLSPDNPSFANDVHYPWFVSPSNGDYRLMKKSILVNAGTNLSYLPNTDLANGERVYGDTVDIGCYEFHDESYCLPPILSVQDVTGSAAMLTWQNSNSEISPAYELSYKSIEDSEWTALAPVYAEYLMLSDLQPQTHYLVRIRTFCDTDSLSDYSDTLHFSTNCPSVTIGETTSNTSNVLPYSFNNYSYTQQIYQESEVGGAMLIDTLSLQYHSSSESRNVDIYLGHTDKTVFVNNNDWVPLSDLTLVYSGYITFNNTGDNNWLKIPLITVFEYDGLSNLVVVFDDNTGSWTSLNNFYTHPTSGTSSMYAFSSWTNYNPASPVSGSRVSYRNNLRFSKVCDLGSCFRPNVSAVEVTDHSAKLVCAVGVDTEGYELEFKESGSDTFTTLTAVDDVCLLTDLRQNTQYVARVRSLCGESQSLWKYTYFTTGVANYNRLYVTTTGNGNGGTWTTACGDINWAVSTAVRIRDEYGTNPDIWVASGTYYGDTSNASAFTLQDGISIYGGFSGNEPADYDLLQRDFETNTTILDGHNNRRVIYQANPFNTRAVLDGFTIQNGFTTDDGGGAYLNHNTVLSNCHFVHNEAQGSGGGLYFYTNYSNDTVSYCSFKKNISGNSGGGVCLKSANLVNCLIANNTARHGGGASTNNSTIANSTIVRNKSSNSCGGLASSSTILMNSVVWGNMQNLTSNNIVNENYVTCSYSAVEGGVSGNYNIPLFASNEGSSFSPYFVHPSVIAGADDSTDNVDWHLQSGSPCVNKGDNGSATNTLDLDGNLRIQHDTIDLGCYESELYGTALPSYDSIVYVTVTGAGSRTGTSWENAVSSIGDAQAVAVCHSAVVWVAAGIYFGDTTSSNAFTMRDGVKIYGGFAGNEPAGFDMLQRDFEANTTVLDGQNSRRVVLQENSFNTCTVLDGFTIRNGYTTGSGGGALLNHNTVLSNCRFIHNTAQGSGGGLYYYTNYSNDTIRNCSFEKNTSGNDGGGVYLNYASLVNCLVANNTSVYSGGGVYSYYSTIANSTIVRNKSSNTSGGIYASSSSTLVNSVVWGNMQGTTISNINASSISCSYSAVEGGILGQYNIPLFASNEGSSFSPRFVNPSVTAGADDATDNVDWHLQMGSPCVNKGDNGNATNTLDLDGNPRIQQDTVDMGCYESVLYGTALPSYDNIVYVTVTGEGTHTGESWTNSISSIEDAQAIAQTYNAVVWVAAGVYYGNIASSNAFTMRDGVSVYGGFAGNEPADFDMSQRDFEANTTVLDGQNNRRVVYQANSFNTRTVLDGFTIQNGNTTESGGGAYLLHNTLLSNCRFAQNVSQNNGGGLYYYGSSYYDTIRGCSFERNTGCYGGGVYALYSILENCSFSHNTSSYSGGGLYLYYSSAINCLVFNNTSSSYGGGVYGEYGTTIANSTIVRNASGSNGGGVYVNNSTTVVNSVIWGNQYNGVADNLGNTSYVSCNYSAVESGITGNNIILLNVSNDNNIYSPYFVHPSRVAGATDTTMNVDWRLQIHSPCINRGDDSEVTLSFDIDGNDRIQQDTVDLGCYESEYSGIDLPVYDSIIYVTQTGAGTMTGESWDNAMSSIEDAMPLATCHNAVVWVAAGTYYGDTTGANAFSMKPGVSVYGGFAGNEPADYDLSLRDFETNTTILDGHNSRRVLYQPNDFTASTAVTWDGFTIQNGRVDGDGAGVYIRNYSSLQHCCVQYNSAYANNNSNRYGGGVYVASNNSSSVQIAYCKIAYNVVEGTNHGYGGGIYTTYAKVHHTEVLHNSSTNCGGGIYAYYSCAYFNCLIHNNASSRGGGVYNYYSNNTYVNCDIVNNSGRGIYCNYSPSFTNCIVWGNKENHMVNNVLGGSYSYCAVEEGVSGTNNITLASTNDGNDASQHYVRFNDPENEDFRLHPTSSCVNVGNNEVVTDEVDFFGNNRIYQDVVDVGCSEVQDDSECPSVVNLNVGNITAHSALLTWHPIGDESKWAVVYNEVGGTQITVMTNDTAFTVTGLSLNRNYTAKVRAICDSDMMSTFSIPVSFRTDCDPTVLDTLSNFTTLMPENGAIVYDIRVSFSWSVLSEATSYDFYLWPVGAVEPTEPSISGLILPSVSNYDLPDYQPDKEYYWKVVAWNECLNKQSEVQTIRVNKYPDLHVSQIVTSNPVAGLPLMVTWTVTNDGEGNTPPGHTWSDYIWISPVDGVGGGFWNNVSEVLLATIPNLTSLNTGESYQNSTTVTVPEDFMGNYYLFVLADQHDVRDIDYSPTGQMIAPDPYTPSADGNPYHYLSGSVSQSLNQVEELPGHEADNFFYKVISVMPPPSPDLVVNSITHPTNTFSGSQLPLTWTITNQGDAAAVGSWYDAVYISEDTVLNTATDLRIGRFLHQGTLLIDGSYTRTEQVSIPIDYMGNYYFFVVTDCMETVYEGLYEQNNIGISNHPLVVTLTPPADLMVTSIVVPDTLDANAQYQCSYSVKNIGASNTYGNTWTDVLYLSKDSVFVRDSARQVGIRYHSGVLSPDSSYHSSMSFTVPNNISGLWYVYLSTDNGGQIFEYNLEDNNVVKRIPAVVVNIPDLTVSNIVVADTVDPSSATRVRWTIRNNGPGNVVNRTFRDCFVYNGQQFYTVAMYNINLAAGDSISRSAMVQIPCSGLDLSELTIITDFEQSVLEINENNNSSTKQLNVLAPNLAVTSVITPDTVWSGTLLPEAVISQDSHTGVSYKIRNDGDLPVIDKVVTDRIYLSASADSYQERDSLVSYTHTITLAPNSTQTFTCQVPIPNGISGNYYFHVVCNVDNAICESNNTSDNVGHGDVTTVNLSPWADLVLTQVNVQDTTFIGANFPVSYTIRNNGTAPLNHVSVCQKFYYSTSPTYFDVNDLVSVKNDNLYLAVGAEVTNVAYMALPATQLQRYYYIHVVTDATDLVYEHTGENNNNAVSNSFFAKYYQLDLAATEIDGPTEVQWGQTATYRMHVNNNSSLPTLVSQWQDALYLSNDPILNSADVLQQMVNHGAVLEAGGDYWTYFNVTIPFGTPATAYLLGYADFNNNNPDINYSNNSTVKAITVSSVPTPDLAVTEMTVLDNVVSGQPARLVYTVENVGELDVSMQTWNDKLFLSFDTVYQSSDIELQTAQRPNMTMAVGDSYTDTITFVVPLPYNGGLNLLTVANFTNQPYEVIRDNNVRSESVTVFLPLPGDLIVTGVSSDDSVVSGSILHASWEIRNIGDYPLSGNGLRTLVYVSRDTAFDANDRLLGNLIASIALGVDEVMIQNLDIRVSGLPEGEYYLIVKTDVTNAFNEVNENNNSGYSAVPFVLTVRPLPFDTDVPDVLRNNEVSDFKLTVGDYVGQTVRIHLSSEDSLAGAVNMIYATHNGMGDNLNYTYSTIGQFTANPELYIPSTWPGYYGVNIYGSTPVGNEQNTVVRADILPFELRAIDADHGGNTGKVTVELTGSHFRPDMKVSLQNGTDTITPDTLIYVNYYQAFATFDLKDRTPGFYDVVAVNFCEGEAILQDGFQIQNASPNGLSYNLIFPNSPRPNRNIVMMLEFGNTGNVDLHDQVLEITSVCGMPIALTPEGITQHQTTIQVPLSIEGEPQGLLRPGSYGNVNIYGYTSSGLVFSIKPVEE